jgi:hypothetical protein
VLFSVIFVSLFVAVEWVDNKQQSIPDFFVGVEFAYGDVSDCKDLVDQVKDYTNLFVVGLPEISLNQTSLNSTCDYIYNAGLSFIVLFAAPIKYNYNPCVWIIKARQKYGDKFLGAYRIDEPGGNQLDKTAFRFVLDAENYASAAETYVKALYDHLLSEQWLESGVRMFTADYGLYWFDYKAGYNTILAEFGWNHSRQLDIALCRGAAKVQNKDWGGMITWTYNDVPYIESSDELFSDLVLAYHAGAKYVLVFDYPKIGRYGILTEEHFDVLKKFWNYIHVSPESHGSVEGKVAYVLPEDYGFGFRNPNDTIWGLWKADESAKKIWDDVNSLLDRHGYRLDVVYSDSESNNAIKSQYDKLIFWNETVT